MVLNAWRKSQSTQQNDILRTLLVGTIVPLPTSYRDRAQQRVYPIVDFNPRAERRSRSGIRSLLKSIEATGTRILVGPTSLLLLPHPILCLLVGSQPWPHLPFDFSGRFTNVHVARLSFCNCALMLARTFSEKPVPTLPANMSPSGPW